jgi:hypothetical protein
MRQTKSYFVLVAIMTLLAISVPVFAGGGTGSLRIDPPLPAMTESPAEFEIWAQNGEAEVVYIFLVMTQASYDGFTGSVVIDYDDGPTTIPKGPAWTMETVNSVKVPPGTTTGAGYTVASLKDHLNTDGPIWWALEELNIDELEDDKETITVTLPSTDPEMLVYIMGKSDDACLIDMRVPPTIPGFVVPEIPLGTIMGLATMLAALAIFAKKQPLVLMK